MGRAKARPCGTGRDGVGEGGIQMEYKRHTDGRDGTERDGIGMGLDPVRQVWQWWAGIKKQGMGWDGAGIGIGLGGTGW